MFLAVNRYWIAAKYTTQQFVWTRVCPIEHIYIDSIAGLPTTVNSTGTIFIVYTCLCSCFFFTVICCRRFWTEMKTYAVYVHAEKTNAKLRLYTFVLYASVSVCVAHSVNRKIRQSQQEKSNNCQTIDNFTLQENAPTFATIYVIFVFFIIAWIKGMVWFDMIFFCRYMF